ncbi:uncharacterized protein VTP21DRAFT_5798 [Calcarisporiella thermophila]
MRSFIHHTSGIFIYFFLTSFIPAVLVGRSSEAALHDKFIHVPDIP